MLRSPDGIYYEVAAPNESRTAALLLDRDGVINRRIVDGYVLNVADFEANAELIDACAAIRSANIPIFVISNQSCVNRGLLTPGKLEEIMLYTSNAFSERGASLSGWFCCPHRPDEGCPCRKPRPGLLEAAERRALVDLSRSVFIGDSSSDEEAARGASVGSFLRYEMGNGSALDVLDRAIEFLTIDIHA